MVSTYKERKHPSNCELCAMNSMPNNPESSRQCSLMEYVENNPVAAVLQALAIGFAAGIVVRLIEASSEKEAKIDVKHKPTLDEAKFHLGSLLLPFVWPAWKKAQEGYEKSADAVLESVEKLKKSDLTSEGKKRLKAAEEWAEREGTELAELGKEKAKELEKWVQDGMLPAADCCCKKLRKLVFG